MGFFSWNCNSCGHPMLSSYATNDINRWMRDVFVIEKGVSILKGEYDGYGRVDGHEMNYSGNCVYHEACWEKAGKPLEWDHPSEDAADQGFFFNDPTHDMSRPT